MNNVHLATVDFHGEPILVAREGEALFVPMKARVEALGLAWEPQLRKLKARKWGMTMMVIPTASGAQAAACLPLRRFDAWVMSVEPNKVRPELQERLRSYQDELADVLWAYKSQGLAVNPRLATLPAEALAHQVVAAAGLKAPEGWKQDLAHKLEQARACSKGAYEGLKEVKAAVTRIEAKIAHAGPNLSVLGEMKPAQAIALLNGIARACANPRSYAAASRVFPGLFPDCGTQLPLPGLEA